VVLRFAVLFLAAFLIAILLPPELS
jgi:hypothetical protein